MCDTAKVPNVWRSSNMKFQNVCDVRWKILDARFVCMNAKSTNKMECQRKYFYLQKVQARSFKWFCTQTIRTSHTVLHWKQLVVAGINKPCLCVTKEGSIRLKWHRHGNGNCCWQRCASCGYNGICYDDIRSNMEIWAIATAKARNRMKWKLEQNDGKRQKEYSVVENCLSHMLLTAH